MNLCNIKFIKPFDNIAVDRYKEIKEKAYNESIPESIRFNIVEKDVRNVL